MCSGFYQFQIDVELIKDLTTLHTLSLGYCSNLKSLCDTSDNILNLKILNIIDRDTNHIPTIFYNLPQLQELSIELDIYCGRFSLTH